MIRTAFAILVATLGVPILAADSTNRLHFAAAGFSVAALDLASSEATYQPLIMCLPVRDGFAANVNVQIQQPYQGTIEDYIKLTMEQFKEAKIKVLEHKVLGKSTALFEYTGESQGHAVHWYARAMKSGNKVYLITATDSAANWSKEADRLKACVDSFRVEGSASASR
jgi:PsbP